MKKVLYQSLFWIIYATINSLLAKAYYPSTYFSDQAAKYGLAVLWFYYTIIILFSNYRLFTKLVMFFLGLSGWFILRYSLYKHVISSIYFIPEEKLRFWDITASGLWWVLHYTIYGYFYWLYHKHIEHVKKVTAQNLELQNQKLKIQYNFLKAQINPHFLYNTLSFFYSKTITIDRQTADGIALLTDIMRYALQQGESDGKVALDDEITHLNNFIELHQMRFDNSLNIQFTNLIGNNQYRILPHILITLVENAFKHGEVNNPLHPLQIMLGIKEKNLQFTVQNKIRKGPRDGPSTGVGTSNIYERLKMEYGESMKFEIRSNDDHFGVTLTIPVSLIEKKQTSLITSVTA